MNQGPLDLQSNALPLSYIPVGKSRFPTLYESKFINQKNNLLRQDYFIKNQFHSNNLKLFYFKVECDFLMVLVRIPHAAVKSRPPSDRRTSLYKGQIQKFESTRNKIGFQYSRYLNELLNVRDVFGSNCSFHTSVVTLKIQRINLYPRILEKKSKSREMSKRHCYDEMYQIGVRQCNFRKEDEQNIILSRVVHGLSR